MTAFLRRWRQRLTGPVGRRLLLALAVLAAWLVWMVTPPRPLREWTTASREPGEWLLTPDRTRLACTTQTLHGDIRTGAIVEPGPVRLWDLATGRERLTAGADQPAFAALRLTPDGSRLLITREPPGPGRAAVLQLWDVETGRERWSTPIFNDPDAPQEKLPANPIVSPDGKFIACRRSDGTGDVLLADTSQVHANLGNSWPLAFAPDGRTLVTASPARPASGPVTVTLWDMTNGRPGRQLTLELAGTIFERELDRQLQRSPWLKREQVPRLPVAAALSPDGHWLAVVLTAGRDDMPHMIELWDLRTGNRAAELDFGRVWDADFRGVDFSPDGSLLVARGPGAPRVWDVRQAPPRAIPVGDASGGQGAAGPPVTLHAGGPDFPLFAPDGSRFIVPGQERRQMTVRATAAPDGVVLVEMPSAALERPDFAPDGRTLAVWCSQVVPLNGWQKAVNELCRLIGRPAPYPADMDPRPTVLLFDTQTGEVRDRLRGFAAETHLIGFGPDGRSVWTFTHTPAPPADGTLRLQEWSLSSSPRPPLWLFAVTALGVLLAVADWRRSRRVAAVGGPTP